MNGAGRCRPDQMRIVIKGRVACLTFARASARRCATKADVPECARLCKRDFLKIAMNTQLASYDAIGTQILSGHFDALACAMLNRRGSGQGGYVCFANAHTTVTARIDPEYAKVLADAFMVLPDGKSVYWLGKLSGRSGIEHVPGPDFMSFLLEYRANPPLRHYFYGSTQSTIHLLVDAVADKYPSAQVVGFESPPFRELTVSEEDEALARIQGALPDFVWVGLGAPKQEIWMAKFSERLRPAILLGVGAAFDFNSGVLARAPEWMRHGGLEWAFRLMREPLRLWRRYAVTNSLFIVFFVVDYLRRWQFRQ